MFETKIIQIKLNRVKNSNWLEANQLAIFASKAGIWTLDLLRTIPASSQGLWITSPVLYLLGNAAPIQILMKSKQAFHTVHPTHNPFVGSDERQVLEQRHLNHFTCEKCTLL